MLSYFLYPFRASSSLWSYFQRQWPLTSHWSGNLDINNHSAFHGFVNNSDCIWGYFRLIKLVVFCQQVADVVDMAIPFVPIAFTNDNPCHIKIVGPCLAIPVVVILAVWFPCLKLSLFLSDRLKVVCWPASLFCGCCTTERGTRYVKTLFCFTGTLTDQYHVTKHCHAA